jgi:hypothetical protein
MSKKREARAGDVWADPEGDLYLIIYVKHGSTDTGYMAKYLNWSQCCHFDGALWDKADDAKFTEHDKYMFNLHNIFEVVEDDWKEHLWEERKKDSS